jgi:hypothetical protein
LALEVIASFINLIQTRPAEGYVRSSEAVDYKRYAELLQENKILKEKLEAAQSAAATRDYRNTRWGNVRVGRSCIEALLHWCLQDPSLGEAAVDGVVDALSGTKKRSFNQIDRWYLDQFIEVAAYLDLLTPDTVTAAKLAQNFRNLIHPGRAARLEQTCDRATAYSAIGALEHVIRDLS